MAAAAWTRGEKLKAMSARCVVILLHREGPFRFAGTFSERQVLEGDVREVWWRVRG